MWKNVLLASKNAGVHCVGGCNIDGEEDSWDFGTGAGFYVDATEEKWKSHYRMYSYITKEVCIVCLCVVCLYALWAHISSHHVDAAVHNKMKQSSPKCSENKDYVVVCIYMLNILYKSVHFCWTE